MCTQSLSINLMLNNSVATLKRNSVLVLYKWGLGSGRFLFQRREP